MQNKLAQKVINMRSEYASEKKESVRRNSKMTVFLFPYSSNFSSNYFILFGLVQILFRNKSILDQGMQRITNQSLSLFAQQLNTDNWQLVLAWLLPSYCIVPSCRFPCVSSAILLPRLSWFHFLKFTFIPFKVIDPGMPQPSQHRGTAKKKKLRGRQTKALLW